ncbi:MAG: 4Fe-4S binding protein [Calditrichota bacterium]
MEDRTVQRLKDELTQKVTEHKRRSDMLVIYQKWCKACGICYDLCPQGTLQADREGKVFIKYPETCTGCKICELHCPDFAILVTANPRKAPKAPDIGRPKIEESE